MPNLNAHVRRRGEPPGNGNSGRNGRNRFLSAGETVEAKTEGRRETTAVAFFSKLDRWGCFPLGSIAVDRGSDGEKTCLEITSFQGGLDLDIPIIFGALFKVLRIIVLLKILDALLKNASKN